MASYKCRSIDQSRHGRLQITIIKLSEDTRRQTPVSKTANLSKREVLGRLLVRHNCCPHRVWVPQTGVHARGGQDVLHPPRKCSGSHTLERCHIRNKKVVVVSTYGGHLETSKCIKEFWQNGIHTLLKYATRVTTGHSCGSSGNLGIWKKPRTLPCLACFSKSTKCNTTLSLCSVRVGPRRAMLLTLQMLE